MTRRVFKFCLALFCCCFCNLVSAAEACSGSWSDRSCFGSLEFTLQNPQGGVQSSTIRMVFFRNDELLAEIEQGGNKKRYLEVKPSGVKLYLGLSENESPNAGKNNPFQFFEMGFSLPIGALQAVFPNGPASIPDAETHRQLDLGVRQITISTVRRGGKRVEFHLSSADFNANGIWDGERRQPLSDDFSVLGWSHAGADRFSVLRDARAAKSKLNSVK